MNTNTIQLLFLTRADFRKWLEENAETHGGIWLVFGKTKEVATLTAADALEEALCFGWIDGQMKSLDKTRYIKYFAKRRPKSIWSEKNKRLIEVLRKKGIMTELGEFAVENAKHNGLWEQPKDSGFSDDEAELFKQKLIGISPAYENFCAMSPSVRRTYTKRYLSFKTEAAREKDFAKIVDRLNHNLKPM